MSFLQENDSQSTEAAGSLSCLVSMYCGAIGWQGYSIFAVNSPYDPPKTA